MELAFRLPSLVRAALSAEEPELAARLTDALAAGLPVRDVAIATSRALLRERAGDHETAQVRFAEAAVRWADLGSRFEQAHALMALGRSRIALGAPAGHDAVADARRLFEAMGASALVSQCDSLLVAAPR